MGLGPHDGQRRLLSMLQTVQHKAGMDGRRSALNGRISGVSNAGLFEPEPQDRDALVTRGTISFPDSKASH